MPPKPDMMFNFNRGAGGPSFSMGGGGGAPGRSLWNRIFGLRLNTRKPPSPRPRLKIPANPTGLQRHLKPRPKLELPPAKPPPQKPQNEGQRRQRSTPLIPGLPKKDLTLMGNEFKLTLVRGNSPRSQERSPSTQSFSEAEKRRLMGPNRLTRQQQLDKLNKPGSKHHEDTRTRESAASRVGGTEAKNRQNAETEYAHGKMIEAQLQIQEMKMSPGGQMPPAATRGIRAKGMALEFPHNQKQGIGSVQNRPSTAADFALIKGATRHLGRVPNAPSMVRTPYGSDRVGGRGIPKDLGPAIDRIMRGTGLGLTVTFGIAGVSEAINESRKRGIEMGAWMSGASSSPPVFLGR